MAYESAACQQVKWAKASTEWIRYDTEEDGDGYGGAYPYGAGMNDHTIHYCYYTSKLALCHATYYLVEQRRPVSRNEYFDSEDADGYGGAYPSGAGMNDHTIHYCYYTSK